MSGQPNRVSTRRVGRSSSSGESNVDAYDFRRPTKLSREHVRTLQIVFETFARQYTTLLTSTLRASSQVSLVSIEQLTYDEYISQLANPTLMITLSVEPLVGAGVLEFSVGSAMACVDHVLGGPGALDQPERPLTEIEMSLLRELLERVLHELKYAFEGLVTLDPQIVGYEYNPQFAQVAGPTDLVLVASFDMKIGLVDTVATVCLPFAPTLAVLEANSSNHFSTERERQQRLNAAALMATRMEDVHVEVRVCFDETLTHPEDLVDLRPGDVVPLRHATSQPLTVRTEDVVFAHATPGSTGKRLAVLVVEPPPRDDGPPQILSTSPLRPAQPLPTTSGSTAP
ncbi:flagellar motor switch protein FliM [Motilibacter rhizosphaerae]|uniref:Flagellar motor switch protein FliM n=1 Tax=Motilibacter rhizosphaerae TaxID=598652 RepID=A0A4Q7NVY2_9ACTN|nr:flagellar motor switch protein FliM [Motilibacter rhizosphaerae]RZS91436.1 flagellar motor switch protein FliM [Motilibacter rhizosphaerae]